MLTGGKFPLGAPPVGNAAMIEMLKKEFSNPKSPVSAAAAAH
jgi:hypothetical protein